MHTAQRSLLAALLSVTVLAQAAGLRSPGTNPGDLNKQLEAGEAPLVIDVRTPDEFSSGHVPGAVNMPVPTVTKHLDEIRQAPKVVLYCNDMRFTRMAEQLLLKSRVTGFSHLEGGLTAWREQGLPLETSLPESTAAPATGT
jgi:rhodanese-related sulfurtransferase